MLQKLFSLENLLEKVFGVIGTLILFLILFLYRPIVVLLSKASSEVLGQIIVVILAILILTISALVIIISLLYSENKRLKSKPDEGVLRPHFGVHWRVYLTTGQVSESPYCGCCSPNKFLHKWNDVIYQCRSPQNSKIGYQDYNFNDETGKEIPYQQAYQKVKELYKRKPK